MAVKVLPREVDRKRLKREVTNLAVLRHPNIVTFYHYESNKIGHFIITEYISGGNVRSKLDDKSFAFSEMLKVSKLGAFDSHIRHALSHIFSQLQILRDAAAAMTFAHSHGNFWCTSTFLELMHIQASFTGTCGARICSWLLTSPLDGSSSCLISGSRGLWEKILQTGSVR